MPTNSFRFISSRVDLSSRPQLSISRGPVFIQTTDGADLFKTDLTGLNRIGFRYTPAGINPPGSALPCRTIESAPTAYRVSWEDRSPFVHVTKDGLGIQGTKGFRSARCNAPIRDGNWYMEVKIIHGGGEHVGDDTNHEGTHVRLGWGRREAPLNGPVGLDGYSYGYRDKTGERVTLSRPRPYGRPFSSGDVVGMYISLPPRRPPNKKDPHDPAHIKRERIPIDLKGQEVFEMLEYPVSKEMAALMDYSNKSSTSAPLPSTSNKKTKLPDRPSTNARTNTTPLRPLPILSGSVIAFFVNGESQGIAFQDIYDYLQLRMTETTRKKEKEKKRGREGVKEHRENPFDDGTLGYYPFVSVFNNARVQLNPGPHFEFLPPSDIDALLFDREPSAQQTWRPISERYTEFMQEQRDLDRQEEEEAKLELERLQQRDKIEAEKKAERARKAEARKRLKTADSSEDLTSLGPTPLSQPSPLRNSTAYDASVGNSPAVSRNSENGDVDDEQDRVVSELITESLYPQSDDNM